MTTFKGQLVVALVLNVGLKVLTFTLSTLLTRKLLPYQNGVYFTFNVYNDAVLFVAREATRNVASRLSLVDEKDEADEKPNGGGAFPDVAAESRKLPHRGEPTKKVDVANVRRVISIALCSIPLALGAALALEALGLCLGDASLFPSMARHARLSQQQQYTTSVASAPAPPLEGLPLLLLPYLPELTVVGCTVLMALVEPCIVVVQSLNLFRVVVVAECATLTARLLTILLIISAIQRRGSAAVQEDGEALNGNGLRTLWETRMALAFGQLAYAVTHVAYYTLVVSGLPVARWLGASAELQQVRAACLRDFYQTGRQESNNAEAVQSVPAPTISLSKLQDCCAFPWCYYTALDAFAECRRQAVLLGTFLRESLLRLVLSEGESFALTSLGSEAARGYYQLIYSLGSLVARLLFRVWENACFVKWSREASLGHQQAAVRLLKLMLRLSFYVGFSFALLGPPITRAFLTTMYTSRWATPQVTTALQLCFYGMPLMAWNGLLEAFLRAVASPAVLQRMQRWMIGETGVYIAACYLTLLSFGKQDTQGDSVSVLVLLNTANMLWRCGASVHLLATSSAGSSAGGGESLLHLGELLHLFPAPLIGAVVLLFAVSRVVAATVVTLAGVGVVYAAVILLWDAEVRGLLVTPVWRRLRPGRRRSSANVAEASTTTTAKKQQ